MTKFTLKIKHPVPYTCLQKLAICNVTILMLFFKTLKVKQVKYIISNKPRLPHYITSKLLQWLAQNKIH